MSRDYLFIYLCNQTTTCMYLLVGMYIHRVLVHPQTSDTLPYLVFTFPQGEKGKKKKEKEKKKNTGKVEYFIVAAAAAAAALRLWFALWCVLSVWWKSSDACVGVTRHIYLIYRS